MFRGDWIKHPAFGVVLFALLALGSISLSQKYQIVSKSAYQSASSNLDHTRYFAPPVKTPVRDPKPSRDEWRDEKDLQAQQIMATWTVFIGFVTLAGVVYVAQTLRATKEATEAAVYTADVTREIGEAQTRGYVEFLPLGIQFDPAVGADGKSTYSARCFYKLRCHGQTPIFHIIGSAEFDWVAPGTIFRGVRWVRPYYKEQAGKNLFPGQSTDVLSMGMIQTALNTGGFHSALINGENLVLECHATLLWKDVFGVRQSQSFLIWAPIVSRDRHISIDVKLLETTHISRVKSEERRP